MQASSAMGARAPLRDDVPRFCTECKGPVVRDPDLGQATCSVCGLVISENEIDQGAEWRAFDHEQRDKRTRVGAPMTYTIHDKGLATAIDWKDKDCFGREVPQKLRAQIYRLRRWQTRIRVSDAAERNLTFALSEVSRISSCMALPKALQEHAAKVYRSAVKMHLIRGRSIEGVVAASIYAACRQMSTPRTLSEIAGASRVGRKEIGRSYRFISERLQFISKPANPASYISRYSSDLKLSASCQQMAMKIAANTSKAGLTSGRCPTGMAAAIVYISCMMVGEKRTQRDMARVAQVTEVTVRNRFKEIVRKLGIKIR